MREFHPYPARFISEIPAQALDLLDVRGPVVDPFCGSGTTLAEARRRGLPAVGVDLNPIACLISRVRTDKWCAGDAERGLVHAHALRERALGGGCTDDVASEIPRLAYWFDEAAQAALAGAVGYLREVEPAWRDRIAAAISSSIVRLSRQESDTRYAAITKQTTIDAAAAELGQALVRLCEWLAANTGGYADTPVEVRCQDARDLSSLPANHFAAAIFSPPYPNAYEYWLYHKYRMYWLGFDPIAVRAAELGARPHYCKRNGLTEDDFASQMSDVFAGLARCLKENAPVAVVIGDSTIRGRCVDNGALIERVAAEHHFQVEAQTIREIRAKRSSFNRAHSRGRASEHVLLFRRD